MTNLFCVKPLLITSFLSKCPDDPKSNYKGPLYLKLRFKPPIYPKFLSHIHLFT